MTYNDWTSWRCAHDTKLFCPEEGCPKRLGCARLKGWTPEQATPREYQGYPAREEKERQSDDPR